MSAATSARGEELVLQVDRDAGVPALGRRVLDAVARSLAALLSSTAIGPMRGAHGLDRARPARRCRSGRRRRRAGAWRAPARPRGQRLAGGGVDVDEADPRALRRRTARPGWRRCRSRRPVIRTVRSGEAGIVGHEAVHGRAPRMRRAPVVRSAVDYVVILKTRKWLKLGVFRGKTLIVLLYLRHSFIESSHVEVARQAQVRRMVRHRRQERIHVPQLDEEPGHPRP